MNSQEIQDLAKVFAKKSVAKKEYNLFSEWHMSENDHTKLLLAMLSYYDAAGNYPILYSFLSNFTKGRGKMAHYKHLENLEIKFSPKCDESNGFIDGWITFVAKNKKIAVIIENKIYDAGDQKDQVRRYISHAKNQGIDIENIWVLYITNDGSKEIDSKSYDIEAEAEETNIEGRFVELNYKEDIIAWINREVLNLRVYPESLTAVARTYVDYLQNDLFDDNASDNEQETLLRMLRISTDLNKQKAEDTQKLFDLYNEIKEMKAKKGDDLANGEDEINTLYRVVSSILKKLESIAFEEFEKVSKEVLDEAYRKQLKKHKISGWIVAHRGVKTDRGYVQMRIDDEWNTIHMEWTPISIQDMLYRTEYYIVLHVEGGAVGINKKNIFSAEEKDKCQSVNFGCRPIAKMEVKPDKPFAKMSSEELKKYLTELYTQKLKLLFDKTIELSK